MRELKVRAWHKPYKQMCNVSMLQFDYDGTICAAVIIEKPFNDQRLAKIDDLIIEQDTGLKDRNGTKINEGDVLVDDAGDGVYGKNHRLVAIEMKRRKGGVTSENQKKWIKTLNEAGIQTVVCKGCDAAIEFIESIT